MAKCKALTGSVVKGLTWQFTDDASAHHQSDINMFSSSSMASQAQLHTWYRRPKATCLRCNTDPCRLLELCPCRSVCLGLAAKGPHHSCTADTTLASGASTYYLQVVYTDVWCCLWICASYGWDVISENLSKSAFSKGGWVTLSANFRRKKASPTIYCQCQKTRVTAISWGIKISLMHCLILSQSTRVTDGQTELQLLRPRCHSCVGQ